MEHSASAVLGQPILLDWPNPIFRWRNKKCTQLRQPCILSLSTVCVNKKNSVTSASKCWHTVDTIATIMKKHLKTLLNMDITFDGNTNIISTKSIRQRRHRLSWFRTIGLTFKKDFFLLVNVTVIFKRIRKSSASIWIPVNNFNFDRNKSKPLRFCFSSGIHIEI